jgi:predicted aspartyl protease
LAVLAIKEYQTVQGKAHNPYPLLPVSIKVGDKEEIVDSLADTGFELKLLLSHNEALRIGLKDNEKINSEPYPIYAANGQKINTDIYKTIIRIGKIKGEIAFHVAHEDVPLIWGGIVGRQLMNSFKILFDEQSNPKKISISD